MPIRFARQSRTTWASTSSTAARASSSPRSKSTAWTLASSPSSRSVTAVVSIIAIALYCLLDFFVRCLVNAAAHRCAPGVAAAFGVAVALQLFQGSFVYFMIGRVSDCARAPRLEPDRLHLPLALTRAPALAQLRPNFRDGWVRGGARSRVGGIAGDQMRSGRPVPSPSSARSSPPSTPSCSPGCTRRRRRIRTASRPSRPETAAPRDQAEIAHQVHVAKEGRGEQQDEGQRTRPGARRRRARWTRAARPRRRRNPFIAGTPPANPFLAQRA